MSPIVDVTDLPYRMLCREAGAAIAYTEMLNIGAILHDNTKTKNMLKTCKADNPSGIQITGRSVKEFEDVSKRKELRFFDLVDINCGCPSLRITGNDSGSYLLNHPDKIAEMIKVLKDKDFTVTVKIRLGFKNNDVLKVAKIVERAGSDLLTVHARRATQGYGVRADWKWISRVKREIGIPVIGNGDVFSGEDVSKMLDICDGAMIARAAIGNPLIFKQILYYLRTGKNREIDSNARMREFSKYLKLAEKYDLIELPRIKFLGGHFLRGFSGAAKAREKFMRLKSFGEVRDFADKLS